MRGRRAAFSDPDVQKLLELFVPVADEVGLLQSHKGPEGVLFRKIAEQGHYAGRVKPTSTRQGIYAAAPSGVLLASVNTADPARMAEMLKTALEKWESLGDEERFAELPAEEGRFRWEWRYPEDGLALKGVSRDLPRDEKPDDWRAEAWNQDSLWYSREEMRRFVPGRLEVGAEHDVPAELVERLARLNLVDNVRGQTVSFGKKDVKRAELRATVTAVEGDRVSLRLDGATRCVAAGKWAIEGFKDMDAPSEQERGVETALLGYADFDTAKGRFTRFDLVAIGTRWGATQYNGRADDVEPAPIGYAVELGGESRVAPAHPWEYPKWE